MSSTPLLIHRFPHVSLREQRLLCVTPGDVPPTAPDAPAPGIDVEKKKTELENRIAEAKEKIEQSKAALAPLQIDLQRASATWQRLENQRRGRGGNAEPNEEQKAAENEITNLRNQMQPHADDQFKAAEEIKTATRELDRLKPPATNGDAHMRQIEDSVSHLSDALQPKDGQPMEIGKVIGGFIELFAALSAACQGGADWTKPYAAGTTEAGKPTAAATPSPEKLKETALRDSIRKQIKEGKARDGTRLALKNYHGLQAHITTKLDDTKDGPAKDLKSAGAERGALTNKAEHAKVDMKNLQDNLAKETDPARQSSIETDIKSLQTSIETISKQLATKEGEVAKLQAEVDTLKAEQKEMEAMVNEFNGQKEDIAKLNTALGPLRKDDAPKEVKDLIAVIDELLKAEPNADLSGLKIGLKNDQMNTLLKGMQEKGMSVTDATSIGCRFDGLSTDQVIIDNTALFAAKIGEYAKPEKEAPKSPADPTTTTPDD